MNRRIFLQRAALAPVLSIPSLPGREVDEFEFSDLVKSFNGSWNRSHRYTREVIEAMPESDLEFRPSTEVRSFVEQILHIASSVYGYAGLVGNPQPALDQNLFVATGKTKKDILTIVDDAFEYALESISGLNEDSAMNSTPWGGRGYEGISEMSAFNVIRIMHDHTAHHRSQCVLYLRLNGIEPPTYID